MSRNNLDGILREGKEYLEKRGIDSPFLDTQIFMMKALGINKIELLMRGSSVLSDEEEKAFFDMVEKRGRHIPSQYIVGECEFMALPFYVDENVLIPRPDTEILVEAVLEKAKKYGIKTITDIGTGSGAIAVSLVKYGIEKANAVDKSEGALTVAKRNAALNGVSESITFIRGDALRSDFEIGDVDGVVSNPPYIERDVIPTLMEEVRDNEPVGALDGGEDGLDFYRAITKNCAKNLKKDGFLFYEIGYNQGSAVSGILKENGFCEVEIIKDLSGLDRVVLGRKL